ncbi:phage GP46 family protein [Morganella morganii]|uniref:phage GP46 family protein n=1 Tax=Morganella morganii TaxID=582 RepID=UPI0013D75AA1|nr:phage GP46 family protein [Morganella morganii]ELB3891412.1 phage GP46 family protein [Morganella morganii]
MNAICDIALKWQINNADIAVENADIALDNSPGTLVIISLFTDRRALDSDVLPDGGTDWRGWWGDSYQKRPIGSRLWLLSREKQMSVVLRLAKFYAEEALEWMTEDGHIRSAVVSATSPADGFLLLNVQLTLPDGSVLPLEFKTFLSGI